MIRIVRFEDEPKARLIASFAPTDLAGAALHNPRPRPPPTPEASPCRLDTPAPSQKPHAAVQDGAPGSDPDRHLQTYLNTH